MMQESTVSQVEYSFEALCLLLYERMFGCLLDKINQFMEKPSSRSNFIGLLDLAGFKIFEFNSFEQLCINFTNESSAVFQSSNIRPRASEYTMKMKALSGNT